MTKQRRHKMAVFNLLEERPLNDYFISLIKPSSIRIIGNTEFVRLNIDAIANNMVYQYIKRRIREYQQQPWQTKYSCFKLVSKNRPDLPDWTKETYNRGENIYEFNADNVPDNFAKDMLMVRDYLIPIAKKYIEQECDEFDSSNGAKTLFRDFAYLKNADEYKDFYIVIQKATEWKKQQFLNGQEKLINQYNRAFSNAQDINDR